MKVYEGRKPVIRCVEHERRPCVERHHRRGTRRVLALADGLRDAIDGDRYFVTLPKNMTIEDVLID
ncbi:MAG: hypothetical protein B7Y95_19500 [Rhizobiales bacterium 32-66-11]|nr:MAG: hypothetical protein B7Y95_19500 [Rhizobiales bacterium 32-66-11]